jgi:DNA-binding NarL/FixJ family response regulator
MQTVFPDKKRFLLIDDHPIVRSALKSQFLYSYPNSIIEESADGKGILEKLALNFYNLLLGHTVTEISILLHLGISTVGTHKGKIFQKLAVTNLLELKLLSDIHKF